MEIVSGNIDILFIEETKIDSTFPEAQFVFLRIKNSLEGTEMPMVEE